MTVSNDEAKPASFYDANYYGVGTGENTSNYRDYGPHSNLTWTLPLAKLIARYVQGPVLDAGACYGHLVRALNHLGVAAQGAEWSPWAIAQRVSPHVQRLDARDLLGTFAEQSFEAVVSLDLLEHLPEMDCQIVIQQMRRLVRPGGLLLHLVGAPMGEDDPSHHYGDPSHVNHQPLEFYKEAFINLGMTQLDALTATLNTHPAWCHTDWNGRWIAFRKPR